MRVLEGRRLSFAIRARHARTRLQLPQLRAVSPKRPRPGVRRVGRKKGRGRGCRAAKRPAERAGAGRGRLQEEVARLEVGNSNVGEDLPPGGNKTPSQGSARGVDPLYQGGRALLCGFHGRGFSRQETLLRPTSGDEALPQVSLPSGAVTAVPWSSYGSPMDNPWKFRHCAGAVTAVPWKSHVSSIDVPQESHGSPMGTL